MIPVPFDHSGRPKPEWTWLDKHTHHALVDLERKYSDIPWLPMHMPCIVPDDTDHFVKYFNDHAIDGLRTGPSFDEPLLNPNDISNSYHRPYWKTLEIYRSESANEWFGTHTIKNSTVDLQHLFPKFYQQIFDLLPYKEIFFVRFWSNLRPVGLHKDQDWTYNLPLSFRSVIHDPNPSPTFYVSKTKGDEHRLYVDLPEETNSFAFNNGNFWHGADHHGINKILMVVSGIPDVDKWEKLLDKSTNKYTPVRVYNQSDFYTVYNITASQEPLPSPHSQQDIIDLYTLLLTSPEIVNVEQHVSIDYCRAELRVIFWNQDQYYKFAERTKETYQAIINRLNQNFINHPVEFFRHTSAENYPSEFPEKLYPPADRLINWILIPYFKNYFVMNIIPLGKQFDYLGKGEFEPSPVIGARFKKDRTSNIVRRTPSVKSRATFPDFIAYNFESVIETSSMKQQPYIYHKFMKLSEDVEKLADEYILDCDNSAVLIAHNSLGEKLNLHTHRLNEIKTFTFTVTVRVTFDDNDMVYKFYNPLDDSDPDLFEYYRSTSLLEKKIGSSMPNTFTTNARSSILVFNGSYVPHTINYTNDIYLFFVYDNVTFRPGMLEKIKQQANKLLFEQYHEDLHLYFFDLNN